MNKNNSKQIEQAFIKFLKDKSGAKTDKELQDYIKTLGKEGLKKAQDEFVKKMQKQYQMEEQSQDQTQKYEHGAKLQYFKTLKHICDSDEELVYYKKGGKVDCGCVKKKMENGGEAPSKNPVENFKKRKINENDTIHTQKFGVRGLTDNTGYKKLSNDEYRKLSNDEQLRIHEKDEIRESQKPKNTNVIKAVKAFKVSEGKKLEVKKLEGGNKTCPKCGKIHAAGMGCTVAKFKMHRQGGVLNRFFFM